MPQFNDYEADGRRLMVEFTCKRCGDKALRPLKDQDTDKEAYGFLHRIKPPEGWKELLHGPLLCRECMEAYKRFMDPTQFATEAIPKPRPRRESCDLRPEALKEAPK